MHLNFLCPMQNKKILQRFYNILLFNFVNISKPKKNFCETKFFLWTRFPSSNTILRMLRSNYARKESENDDAKKL